MTWLCIFVRSWHSLHVFPRLSLITFSRNWHRLHVFPRLSLVTCFPAFVTGHRFSRVCHWSHVFLRLSLVTCFPALVTGYMFSHACHWSHVFPRLSLVTCFPAFVTGHIFSRAWHWLHVFPRLALVKCFRALGIGCVLWRYFGFGLRIVTRTKASSPRSLTCFRRCKHSPRALSQIHSTLSKLTLSKCSAVHVTAVTDFTCPRKCCRHSPLTTSQTRTPPLAAPLTTCRLLV